MVRPKEVAVELILLIVVIALIVALNRKRRPVHVGGDLVIWRAVLFWCPLAIVAGWLALRALALV